jgi:4'-phosphopantetheinyl transferase
MPENWQASCEVLSPAERTRAAKFVFERDAARFTFHHTALRMILARYTGLEARSVPLAVGAGGKPFLEAGSGGWQFSLSHSGPAALCAVAEGREVGVDLERLRPMPHALEIAGRFFAPAERDALGRLEAAARDAAFFACWTRKEALVKATGEGFRRDLSSFAVPVDPARRRPWRVEALSGDQGWTGICLPPVPGFACALVVAGEAVPLNAWEFRAA